MTRLIDNICTLRDVLESKQDRKLVFYHKLINDLAEEISRQATQKARDYNYCLEFTSQDLRELAKDIRDTLKRWSDSVIPEKLIKKYGKDKTEIDLNTMTDKIGEVLRYRTDNIEVLTRLQGICEGQGAILYFMELASGDKTAELTERLI